MKPLISVLMLTYNQGDYIERSIKSVLDQQSDHYDLEILIIDDGSSDNTMEIVQRVVACSPLPIRLIARKHEGVSAIAKNFLSLINLSKGDYIAFLAGDDYYIPDRFSSHLCMFSNNENLEIVYSDGVNCENGEMQGSCHPLKSISVMQSQDGKRVYQYLTSEAPVLFIQGVLAKGDFIRSIQPFDVDLIADDWVFNIKVFRSLLKTGGAYFFDPSPQFVRNIHGENTSRNLKVHYERVSQVAERYCHNTLIIKSRFIGQALVAASKNKEFHDFWFFARKIPNAPLALYWFFKSIIRIGFRRLRL